MCFLQNTEEISPSFQDSTSANAHVATTSLPVFQTCLLCQKSRNWMWWAVFVHIYPCVTLSLVAAVPALGSHLLRLGQCGGTLHHVLCMWERVGSDRNPRWWPQGWPWQKKGPPDGCWWPALVAVPAKRLPCQAHLSTRAGIHSICWGSNQKRGSTF